MRLKTVLMLMCVKEDRALQWFSLVYASNSWEGNSVEIVNMLIGAGCDVNQADEGGFTALHWAVDSGGKSIVEALLRGGANPNIVNEYGDAPCHYSKTPEVLRLLRDFGGDLTLNNNENETPFQRLTSNLQNLLRPIYEAWTPHRMLPRWEVKAFPLYIEGSSAFGDAIITLLLCLRRYRHVIPKGVGMEIVEYVAEMHRKEMWWPAWRDFDMEPFM